MNAAPVIAGPAVIVRGARDVAVALAPGRRMTLLSAPGAAAFAGPLWWAALTGYARTIATAEMGDLIDVGDAPGTALAALRCGCLRVALAPCPAWDAVTAVADELGASLQKNVPPSLDLGLPGAAHRLVAWLDGDFPPALT